MKRNIQKIIDKCDLKKGAHANLNEGYCVMELVSYLANEPWSDRPQCACPILTEYTICINDRFNDEHRQLLKPIIPLLLNSRVDDDKIKIARKQLIMWRNVTALYPLILDECKMPELADKLRKFTNCTADMAVAEELLAENKKQIYAYASALRGKIAEIAVETLRLACEVKTETV